MSVDDRVVVVDEAALLEFMQYRARAFAGEAFADRLAAMSPEERQRLIDDYVREEVLYREAKALGMDEDDYIIRRRLVQKVEFITESLAREVMEVSDEEVEAYFLEHRARYYVEPHVTFTHVFFDADKRGWDEASAMAAAKLAELNDAKVPFAESVAHGDRFPFHLNYVERTPDFIESHFGAAFRDAVFSMTPDTAEWRGPVESKYGAHLIMVSDRGDGRDAELEEVYGRVREDAEFARKNDALRESLDAIVGEYEVRVLYEPADGTP